MFPAKYQGAMFIARHGPWNRTKKYADIQVAWPDGKGGARLETFMTGFVENNNYLGRPVKLLVMKDGSLLVSDDHAGAIYRIATAANDRVKGLGRFALELTLMALAASAGAQTKPRSTGKAASAPPPPTLIQSVSRRCAPCHGANGRSDIPGTPVLAGQHSFYAITQLFLFREGRRSNEAMSAVARTMTDADLRGFSDFIGTLPPLPATAPATAPDAARMRKGAELAQQHKCVFCHGPDFAGGQQVPRASPASGSSICK